MTEKAIDGSTVGQACGLTKWLPSICCQVTSLTSV